MKCQAKPSVLDNCENLYGRIDPRIKNRIKKFIKHSTPDNWSDISGIVINDNFETIWQAVSKLDPTFPTTGRRWDQSGKMTKEWERIPTPFEVLQAIKLYT